MNTSDTVRQRQMSQARKSALIIVFCAFLLMPILGLVAGFDTNFRSIENRDPAPLPSWPATLNEVKDYTGAIEKAVNDSFGLRSQLVTANNWLRYEIGVSGSQRILVGKDGWLFLNDHNLIQDFRGLGGSNQKLIDDWFDRMEDRRRFLESLGIDFIIAFVPNKHTIYSEFLPDYVTRVTNNNVLNAIFSKHKKRRSKLNFVDLRPSLLKAKKDHRLYHATDNHWTQIGAFIGYREVMKSVLHFSPTAKPIEFDELELEFKQRSGLGNAKMLGIHNLLVEDVIAVHPPSDRRISGRVKLDDYRPVTTVVVESDIKDAPTAFVIGDSFLLGQQRLFERSFSKTVFTDRRARGFDRDLIRKEKPDIVIYQTIERNIFQEKARD